MVRGSPNHPTSNTTPHCFGCEWPISLPLQARRSTSAAVRALQPVAVYVRLRAPARPKTRADSRSMLTADQCGLWLTELWFSRKSMSVVYSLTRYMSANAVPGLEVRNMTASDPPTRT